VSVLYGLMYHSCIRVTILVDAPIAMAISQMPLNKIGGQSCHIPKRTSSGFAPVLIVQFPGKRAERTKRLFANSRKFGYSSLLGKKMTIFKAGIKSFQTKKTHITAHYDLSVTALCGVDFVCCKICQKGFVLISIDIL